MITELLLQAGDPLRRGLVGDVGAVQEVLEGLGLLLHVLLRLHHPRLELQRRGLDALVVPLEDRLEAQVVLGDLGAHEVQRCRRLAAEDLELLPGGAGLVVQLLDVGLQEAEGLRVGHHHAVELGQPLHVPSIVMLETAD